MATGVAFSTALTVAADTLPAWREADVPREVAGLYASFDPDKEPLDLQVVREFEQDGVVVRLVTYTVGTFKGRAARMGAYLGVPKQRAGKIPAVIQMHGGGQTAQAESVIALARNGYVGLAMNWGGNPMKHQQPGDAGTDWGAVDATQTGHNSHYGSCAPDAKTIDAFESPRNSNWYLIILAAKRGLSVLQQMPEVDAQRLGATGHSMGGKLTVMLAGCDARIKAATPSCGGVGSAPEELYARPGNAARPRNPSAIHERLIEDQNYLRRITCPIVYLGPQNDFNGLLDELFLNWKAVPAERLAFSISKHFNHRHERAAAFVEMLWFESFLKQNVTLPQTPEIAVALKSASGVPRVTVRADRAGTVAKVDIFYSLDPNGQFRFWRTAATRREGDVWVADCPVLSSDLPLYFMANVHYPFPKPELVGPPWNKSPGADYLLSSRIVSLEAPQVRAASLKPTDRAERMIQASFADLQDWYELEPGNGTHHVIATRKVKDPKWRGPDGATLELDVLDARGGDVVLEFEFNSYGQYGRENPNGNFYAVLPFAASPDWQTLRVRLDELKPLAASAKLPANWQTLCTLHVRGTLPLSRDKGATVVGSGRFDSRRQLRNLRWAGGAYPQNILMPGGTVALDAAAYQQQFQKQIDQSIELEKRDAGATQKKNGTQ